MNTKNVHVVEQFIKEFILEGKNEGILSLLDELYKSISKEKFASDEEKFESLKNQISIYMGGPNSPRGSSRMVFPLDDKRVIKLALNEAGFAQNGMEATIGMDDEVSDVITPVLATSNITDYDGFFWIASKRIQPLNDKSVGKDWKDFSGYLMQAARTDDPINPKQPDQTKVAIPAQAAEKRKKETEEERKKQMTSSDIVKNQTAEFFESFRNFVKKYKGARTGDLFKPDSWGIDGDKLKLIDYGYTKRISDDFYVGGFTGGSKKAKESLAKRNQERIENIKTTVADNIDDINNTRKIPPMITLLLLLKGVVAGLPMGIETFAVGNPIKPLTPVELSSTSKIIRSNQGKVERIIDLVPDEALKNKLQSELDDILISTGTLEKTKTESLLRMMIRESIKAIR